MIQPSRGSPLLLDAATQTALSVNLTTDVSRNLSQEFISVIHHAKLRKTSSLLRNIGADKAALLLGTFSFSCNAISFFVYCSSVCTLSAATAQALSALQATGCSVSPTSAFTLQALPALSFGYLKIFAPFTRVLGKSPLKTSSSNFNSI